MKMFKIIFSFFLFIFIKCQECRDGLYITDSNCFNEITYLDIANKYYRAGHFAMNTKGDLIIEYSYLNFRLFFGFKSNGKFYFPEITKEIELQDNRFTPNNMKRYESINSFVSLVDDINKQKEYLLSISSYISVLELYDFENQNENDYYKLEESINFFGNSLGIYSFVFQILEAKINNEIIYFCVYTIDNNNGLGNFEIYIKKFGFSNFNFEIVRVNHL